ncbi:cell migration-inducing and hyaluronan-binding protein [Deinobacterium chartae]|uniref:Cell migration-inducing and hyaluronan-binding protein n=1 Tax=Deinobacterium chartae TaxID=521158 RepID=A0A841I0B3_9DEIO|nr:cell migration-inducing and hyaluronan-binding protein [Deinobacterium chartae]
MPTPASGDTPPDHNGSTPTAPDGSGTPAPGATPLRWSDPATWGGKLPAEGDTVTIPTGKRILLDQNPPALGGLTVLGTLEFDRRDLELRTDWIMLHGHLEIGSETRPFTQQARIILTDRKPGEDLMGMGDKVIGVMGGTLDIHGEARGPVWTRLAQTAPAGAQEIVLEGATQWRVGDRIVIASTDFDPAQAEERLIRSVSGNRIGLSEPLKYTHWGQKFNYGGTELDERAEVALLTRNVRIEGEEATSLSGIGAQMMVMDGGKARLENLELTRVGQRNVLRRYPIHFHMLGAGGTGSYVRSAAIHGSFNRCLTVHGTNNLEIKNNVAYNAVGHCYFLEDGAETGNVFEKNLGILTRKPDANRGEQPLLDSDRTPATFWITHPANTFVGNVAAGSQGTGFWIALPEHPTGLSGQTAAAAAIWPRRTPLGRFEGNVAHSNANFGLDVDHAPKADGSFTETASYDPRSNPADPKSSPVIARFENFTAFKNRNQAIWLRGRNHVVSGAKLADNAVGVTLASSESGVENSLIVGETANLGTPNPWEIKGPGGRSLPRPWNDGSDFPLRGFEFYDGQVWAKNVTFADFREVITSDGRTRKASGLSYRRRNSFSLNPHNYIEGARWLDNSPRVYFEDPMNAHDGDKSSAFVDRDGSVTGKAGTQVVSKGPLLFDGSCSLRAEWNAYTCNKKYGRFFLEDLARAGSGPVTLEREDGASVTLVGTPAEPPRSFSTTLEANRSYQLSFANGAPSRFRVGLTLREGGDTLRLSLPYPGGTPTIYRDWWIDARNTLKRVGSVAELEASTGDSYFLEGGVLHLKLMVKPGGNQMVLDVCRQAGCT